MNKMLQDFIPQLSARSANLPIHEVIRQLEVEFPGQVTFSSSFSYEDQVITHEILNHHLNVSIFTLDTGRLFAETYSVWNTTNEKYNTHIVPFYPKHDTLEKFVTEKGPNSFYESVENRKECCFIRKVEPLKRALAGKAVWITGLRAEHSPSRSDLGIWMTLVIAASPLMATAASRLPAMSTVTSG